MRAYLNFIVTLLLTGLIISGCSDPSGTNTAMSTKSGEIRSLADTTAEQTTLNYYEWQYTNFDEYQRPFIYDVDYWSKEHAEEILKTLEVADIMSADNLSLALVRFSVGSNVFREAIWLRRYGDKWTVSSDQYFSTYNDDPFDDGKPERAKEMIDKEEAWKENSASKF